MNKPLKFTLENEEILLHIMSDMKTAQQQQVEVMKGNLEVMKHHTEVKHELLATMTDIASALIHLADKFPEISDK